MQNYSTKMSIQKENEATLLLQEQLQDSALDVIQPILEKAMVLAAGYAKACGRDTLLGEDMEYAMKYCAMHEVGKKLGSHFPEIYEEDSDSDNLEDELEIIDEDEEDIEFTRYSGREYKYVKINMAYDNWNEWVPKNPTEQMLKNAIDSNEHL